MVLLPLPPLRFRLVMALTRKKYSGTVMRGGGEGKGAAQHAVQHTAIRLASARPPGVYTCHLSSPVLSPSLSCPLSPHPSTPHPSTPHLPTSLVSEPAAARPTLFPSFLPCTVTVPSAFSDNRPHIFRHLVQKEDDAINGLKQVKM